MLMFDIYLHLSLSKRVAWLSGICHWNLVWVVGLVFCLKLSPCRQVAFILGFGVNNLGGNLFYTDSTSFVSKGNTLWFEPGQTVKQRLQYLEIPLGLKGKTEEVGDVTFFWQLGGNPMINIGALATSDDGTYDKENIRESVHVFNLGYHAGLGLEYRLGGSTALIGGIRWTSGLTDVTSNDDATITVKAISIHLGILFWELWKLH